MAVRYCPHCGEPVAYAGAGYCAYCGERLEIGRAGTGNGAGSGAWASAAYASETHPYRRPLWLVVGLTIATFGLYWYYWIGKSWAEMKREVRDPGMDPIGHALAMLVPIYGWFRLHAHFRILNELLERVGSPRRVEPSLAVIWAIVASLVNRGAIRLWNLIDFTPDDIVFALMVDWLGTLLLVGFVAYGQQALNEYWDTVEHRPLRYRVSVWQWILLAIGGFSFVYGFLTDLGVLAASFMLAAY